MPRLLYIKASPREERSYSIAVADAFVEAWNKAHPDAEVVIKDLFLEDLPTFDGNRLKAKYNVLHGEEHSAEEKAAWDEIVSVIDEFKSFDGYVFAVPMWNFSIPYPLKHYIDILAQPGLTFGLNDQGYFGMLEGKKAVTVYSSGGEYPAGNPLETFNFQSTYLGGMLGFIGVTDVHTLDVRGTLMGAGPKNKDAAIAAARELAQTF